MCLFFFCVAAVIIKKDFNLKRERTVESNRRNIDTRGNGVQVRERVSTRVRDVRQHHLGIGNGRNEVLGEQQLAAGIDAVLGDGYSASGETYKKKVARRVLLQRAFLRAPKNEVLHASFVESRIVACNLWESVRDTKWK